MHILNSLQETLEFSDENVWIWIEDIAIESIQSDWLYAFLDRGLGLLCSTLRGTHARLPTIAVKREWQRRGIGEALLSEILQRLQRLLHGSPSLN
jgi:ribosomal protein S18 acetylase RimI-like enzyme